MKRLCIFFVLWIILLTACGSAPARTVEATRGVKQTVLLTQAVSQTAIVTQNVTETPTPQSTTKNSMTPPPTTLSTVHIPVFDRIQMFDESRGWAISSETMQLLRTTDGGMTWRDVTPSGLEGAWSSYSNAYFLDAMTAWIPSNGKVFRTSDGGKTWQNFSISFDRAKLQFIDSKNGWAFADWNCGAGTCMVRLFHTNDGGQTWSLMNINNPNGPEVVPTAIPPGSIHIIDGDSFKFSDSSTLWFGGNGVISSPSAILMISRDHGQSWQKQDLPTPQHPQNSGLPNVVDLPTFLTVSEGYFAAKYDVPGGNEGTYPPTVMAVYATRDGGRTWTIRPTLVANVWLSDTIEFVSLKDAFVRCGDTLCVTHDGAETWQTVQSNKQFTIGSNGAFTAYDFVDAQTGWAIAPDERDSPLYKTTDGGVTWTALNVVIIPGK